MNNLLSNHKIKPSYIREILKAAINSDMISLAGGLPAESSFPVDQFRTGTLQVLEDSASLQYSSTEGEPELRQWIANHLNADPTQILVTNGAQQAMDLVARTFLQAGDTVVVEAPAYLGALQIFELAQAKIVSIDQTPTGPDLDQLALAFQQRPKLFYAVPDFHNPTGCCWSEASRREVAILAKKYGVMIMEDAPYRELRYDGSTLPNLYELAPEQVFHIGSFSKVAAPGLRLGYLCAGANGLCPGFQGLGANSSDSDSFISQVGLVKQATDLHSSTFCQRLLLSCLAEPFYSEQLRTLRALYRNRRDTLVTALQTHIDDKVSFITPEGGMFLWLTLPCVDTDQLAELALKHNIAFVPGSVFYPEQDTATKDQMRLNFTHAEPSQLGEGIERLAALISR